MVTGDRESGSEVLSSPADATVRSKLNFVHFLSLGLTDHNYEIAIMRNFQGRKAVTFSAEFVK